MVLRVSRGLLSPYLYFRVFLGPPIKAWHSRPRFFYYVFFCLGSEDKKWIMNLSKILNCISSAAEKMNVPIGGKTTSEQKLNLQNLLAEEFKANLTLCSADIEHPLSADEKGNRDRCDVYAETSKYQIIVELDATRADQVAKKMLSRYYYANKAVDGKPTIYICLLYPGTESMNPAECVKYMDMGKEILLAMNPANRFIGGFLKDRTVEWKNIG